MYDSYDDREGDTMTSKMSDCRKNINKNGIDNKMGCYDKFSNFKRHYAI